MRVKDLKKLLENVPDEMQVLIPTTQEFDGAFYSPCIEESGEADLGTEDLSEEDIKEYDLLNKELPAVKSFVLVRCGFFEEHQGPPVELN
jgi:L-rhamnose isomerase